MFIVTSTTSRAVWGPFATQGDALDFADFVTAKIDPAVVRKLMSPMDELLAWHQVIKHL